MRADVRGPTTRFRRRHGRQGNRRQLLSSAVAGGTTGGQEERPLPHFPAEVGERPSLTLVVPGWLSGRTKWDGLLGCQGCPGFPRMKHDGHRPRRKSPLT
ncbi:hypothetical protein H8959_019747 [Pygathrix nigripes]